MQSSVIEKTVLNVTALVVSRIKRSAIDDEAERLYKLAKPRAYAEAAAVLLGLFILALIAASFGWIGLGLYFLAVVVLFR